MIEKIMKRITILAIAIIASVASLSAQQEEYKSISLHHKALNEIQSSLPTVINIVDGNEGEISVSYPTSVEELIKVEIWYDALLIERKDENSTREELKALNEKQPIRIEVCSSKIKSILNTSDMSLNIHRDSFANWLEIINTSTLFINGKSLTAKDKIELYNTGTMTSNIKGYTADNLMLTNTGYLYVKGKATAKYIEQNSTGIESTDLDVECRKLNITSTGSGVITYRGTADEVDIISTGRASIRTSELNK